MATTQVVSSKGNSTGPDSSHQFHLEVQLGQGEQTSKGFKMYYRCLVYVDKNTSGTTLTSNLTCSWTSTKQSLGNTTGLKVDSGWVYLGEYTYGQEVSFSANCYYTGGSGTTYKSSATAKYTVPYVNVGYVKDGDTFKRGNTYVKTEGVWTPAMGFVKVDGVWKQGVV